MVSCSFHSPPGVLFTFPSRYCFTIGHRLVFSLGEWSPQIQTRFHVPGLTRVQTIQLLDLEIHSYHVLWPVFPDCSSLLTFFDCTTRFGSHDRLPHNTNIATSQNLHICWFRLGARSLAATSAISVDFFSSRYLDVSVP